MEDTKNAFLRKLEVRQKAIENMGRKTYSSEKQKKVLQELELNISQANLNWHISAENNAKSKRFIIGPFITFVKKIIRKMICWYITPLLEQQNAFNSYIVRSINMFKEKIDYYDTIICNEGEKAFDGLQLQLVDIKSLREEFDEIEKKLTYILKMHNIHCDMDMLEKENIDYFAFEDKFRGSREHIIKSQMEYLKYFPKDNFGYVLDIGCGRGEFLEIMWNHSIQAVGIDAYMPFVTYCRDRGFDVRQEDALTFLSKQEDNSLNGIFMAHVIEHISLDYKLALIRLAYRKLKIGRYFVLETPNPQSLLTYIDFYIDPTHIAPVHYKTLEFLFKQTGYSNVERFNNPNSKFKDIVTGIAEGKGIDNFKEFNYGMGNLNEWLSGYQDYTLIAKK